MKIAKHIASFSVSLLFTGLLASSAQAATAVFDFSTSLDSSFSDSNVATLSIADVIGGGTQWTLSSHWNNIHSGAFVNFLDYTYHGANTATPSGYNVITGIVNTPSFGAGPAHTSAVRFQTKNNSGRFNNGESVSWNVLATSVNDFSVNYLKINAINDGESVRFSPTAVSPVPEPSTAAMMLAGIFGLGWVRRRRQQASRE